MRWAQAYSNEADTFSQSFKQRVSFHDKEPNVFSIPSRHGSFNEESNHLPIQLLQQSPPRPSPLHSSIPHNESIEGLNEKRQSSSNTVLRHIPVAAEPIVPHRSKSFRRFLSTIFGDFGKTMVIDIGESNTKMVAATSSSTSTTDMDTSAAFDSIETLSSGGDVKRRKSIGELFKNWRREQRSKTGASAEIESTDNVATSLGGRIVWK